MSDFSSLKDAFDLLKLVEHDLGPGRRSGRWRMYHCPFPGHIHGDRRPSLAVTADNGRWHCFACGRSGDVLSWLRLYRQLTWQDILRLGDAGALHDERPQTAAPYRSEGETPGRPGAADAGLPPQAGWQKRGMELAQACELELWAAGGAKALSWLHGRGLKDGAIRHYRLGYNPQGRYEPAERWGLEGGSVWLPRGVTVPCIVEGALWQLKIRRPAGRPKYAQPRGGKAGLFGADDLRGAEIILLTEGELDCVLAGQELGDVLGAATLGSAAKRLDLAVWGRYLLPARLVLAAYDLDAAGESGGESLRMLSARVHRLQTPRLRPEDKDLTDYFCAGGDLWEWLKHQLQGLGALEWGLPEGV